VKSKSVTKSDAHTKPNKINKEIYYNLYEMTQSYSVLCINDKCIIPTNKILEQFEKKKMDYVHEIDNKTGHMKRFENLGIPMFLLHERVTYDTDDDVVEIDEMIDTNDHAMLSEDIYNILLQNVITNHSINNEETDKKKKKAKNEKTTKKTQKKIQKTTTKTQKKNRK